MPLHRHRLAFLAVWLVVLCTPHVTSVGSGSLHPCRLQRPSVKTGGSFVVGFAFLMNGDDSALSWGTPEDGPHPCSTTDQAELIANSVVVSYFNVEVDKLTLLDSTNQIQERFSEGLNNVTVVAFSGGYRSKPHVLSLREGDEWRIVRSLALIADFDKEGLRQFQWFDLECGECQRGDKCLRLEDQTSCGYTCDLDEWESCRSEIYISFDGVDKNDEVLNSAAQIRRLKRASVSHVYRSGRDFASQTVEQI